MNHIGTVQLKLHRLPDRQSDLIRKLECLPAWGEVTHSPPPLLTRDDDFQTTFRRRSQESWYWSKTINKQNGEDHCRYQGSAADNQYSISALIACFGAG